MYSDVIRVYRNTIETTIKEQLYYNHLRDYSIFALCMIKIKNKKITIIIIKPNVEEEIF